MTLRQPNIAQKNGSNTARIWHGCEIRVGCGSGALHLLGVASRMQNAR
jgi:hypothetical protein